QKEASQGEARTRIRTRVAKIWSRLLTLEEEQRGHPGQDRPKERGVHFRQKSSHARGPRFCKSYRAPGLSISAASFFFPSPVRSPLELAETGRQADRQTRACFCDDDYYGRNGEAQGRESHTIQRLPACLLAAQSGARARLLPNNYLHSWSGTETRSKIGDCGQPSYAAHSLVRIQGLTKRQPRNLARRCQEC
ncbi:Hypothetical predicted protein, partial [Podarcis lilfordi]